MSNYFLFGGGKISEDIINMDWNGHTLGPIERWPSTLKTSLSNCLNSPFPIQIFWGPQMTLLYNYALMEFLDGKETRQAFGKPAKEIWADFWPTIGPLLENVKSTGEPILLEDQLFPLKTNGKTKDRYFTFSYSPIRDSTGIMGVLNIIFETTEKILNERQTRLEQEKMQRIFSQAPAAICILEGPQLIFQLVNPVYQKLFPGRDLLGKPLLDALPEIKGTPIYNILLEVYHSGKTFEGKELLVPLPKTEGGPLENVYFNFIYQARWNDQNQIEGVLAFAYDVTDLVLARQAAEQLAIKVEEQAKTFDVTLTAIKDFIYTFDTEGRFTYSNKPLLELLGINLDQIIGKNFYELPYPPELAHVLQSQIAQVLKTGKSITDETFYTNPRGTTGYYEYIFTPVSDEKGKIMLVAGSTRDISERKKSEEDIQQFNKALIKVNKELTKVNDDLDSFLYTASHDLKTPISNIEGLIIALKNHMSEEFLENPVAKKLIMMIQASIERFNKTIQNLTDITKLQRFSDEKKEKIDLLKVVGDIKLDLARTILETNAHINLEFSQNNSLFFSPKNIRSVIYNLISNALKYRSMDRDPVIRIYFEDDPDFNVVKVEDNGLGMDLSQEESIFGMFTRFHNHVEGTGIGLYMVKKIMENANGKVEVKSTVGKGSEFKLFFEKNQKHNEEA